MRLSILDIVPDAPQGFLFRLLNGYFFTFCTILLHVFVGEDLGHAEEAVVAQAILALPGIIPGQEVHHLAACLLHWRSGWMEFMVTTQKRAILWLTDSPASLLSISSVRASSYCSLFVSLQNLEKFDRFWEFYKTLLKTYLIITVT